jgi:hypothetical protein
VIFFTFHFPISKLTGIIKYKAPKAVAHAARALQLLG